MSGEHDWMTRLENITRDTIWRDGGIYLHDMPPSNHMSGEHDWMTRLDLDDMPRDYDYMTSLENVNGLHA